VVPASPFGDLDRPPLRPAPLQRALGPEGWRLEVVDRAGSTNAVVLVAEQQTAGRGRLDRSWVSPARAGLTFSVLLRPDLPQAQWPWVPLLAGLAVADVVREQGEVEAFLKWPNDVLVAGPAGAEPDRKLCGVLAEVVGPDALVLGIGLNVTTTREELPHDGATSLRLEDAATTDRDTLLRAVLRELAAVRRDPAAARDAYRERCSTLGRHVRVELPGREPVEGTAEAVDDAGRLVVDGVAYGAGDVVHVRPGLTA
jgi:BirA family biotin operon repressor/biotin-[acetyl-CoA-carboxylase] ligase